MAVRVRHWPSDILQAVLVGKQHPQTGAVWVCRLSEYDQLSLKSALTKTLLTTDYYASTLGGVLGRYHVASPLSDRPWVCILSQQLSAQRKCKSTDLFLQNLVAVHQKDSCSNSPIGIAHETRGRRKDRLLPNRI